MRANLKRLIKRRNKRGAALVEAVVVIPFFIIIFASILFVGNLYKEKMRVMRLAKESAWSFAMANCGVPGDPMTTNTIPSSQGAPGASDTKEGPPAVEGVDMGEVQNASTKGGEASKDFGTSKADLTSSVSADGYIGGFTKSVKSHTEVMCNETPYDGDLKGFLQAGWQAFTKW